MKQTTFTVDEITILFTQHTISIPAGLEAAFLRTTTHAVASVPASLTNAAAVDPTATEPEEITTLAVPTTVVPPAPATPPAAIAVPVIPVNTVPPALIAASNPYAITISCQISVMQGRWVTDILPLIHGISNWASECFTTKQQARIHFNHENQAGRTRIVMD
ncbi:hypothetical protein BDN71DRAFT_1430847 [Pleurotus eryngii]|uniref:Uncharacterized protein n=1 Tax=Pleurotus eryngii TaxID=5323 RepID=A0A9P5ZW85_PLEER|nr:hypothetical protein BDN71DRAFT_1430847 [Pleurotus eryngii]